MDDARKAHAQTAEEALWTAQGPLDEKANVIEEEEEKEERGRDVAMSLKSCSSVLLLGGYGRPVPKADR